VAASCGVDHIVGFASNRGLARAFQYGIDACLARGADVIVNTDADNQYCGEDIAKLVAPIVAGEADLVIGDRETHTIEHFSPLKKFLQKHGSRVAAGFAGTEIPDATSGFRAFSRAAALDLNVLSDFSYTLETLIQAGRKRLAVRCVPVRTNEQLRESRLFRSMFEFIKRSGATLIRVYTTYEPLKVFLSAALLPFLVGLALFARFFIYYLMGQGGGKVQSLLLGVVLFLVGGFLVTIGILSDMITANRKLLEEILRRERDRERMK